MRAEDVAEGDALRRLLQRQLRMRGITDEAVLQAMARVPRHLFVPRETLEDAYADQPLPIGYGQTISQPYIVAVMSMLLDLTKESRVLEIGTGCGYQTAILAELAGEVYSVEIVEGLYRQAKARLAELGYARVQLRLGDGYYGWAEHAPYDAILATCAPEQVPPPLSAQLRDGGRLVIPVGSQGDYQVLYLLRREGDKVTTQRIFEVAFVPLTGPHDQDPDAADD
ncbi:MAG: protein-L-isoaspartate(D-aspartate) O-methyltransferase [Chloroflexi bacterium]|nr:protein-L-isoaspartate(D-aspartate) O-methyltransferase [Chloroflexota bacterium]